MTASKLRPNDQRANLLVTLLWVSLIVQMISMISTVFQYLLLRHVSQGNMISMETAQANDLREQAIAILYLIVFIITAVFFIRWFRRGFFNMSQIHSNMSASDGWTAGSWFIPIYSLYRPYQLMKEMFEVAQGWFNGKKEEGFKHNLELNKVSVWWTFWIISSILGQIVFRMSRGEGSVEQMMNADLISIVNDLVAIPLTIFTVAMIKNFAAHEQQIFEFEAAPSPSIAFDDNEENNLL